MPRHFLRHNRQRHALLPRKITKKQFSIQVEKEANGGHPEENVDYKKFGLF